MIIDTTDTTARSPEESGSRRIHRKAYMLRCPGCGKTFITFVPREQREVVCRDCGAHIPLVGLRKLYAVCRCGGYSALHTNIFAPEIEVGCPACRRPMTAVWDPLRRRYECGLEHPAPQKISAESAATALGLMVLHDKFGFGPERARRFAAHMRSLQEEVRSGEVTLRDVTAALEADGIKTED